jgi:hypothetical protein
MDGKRLAGTSILVISLSCALAQGPDKPHFFKHGVVLHSDSGASVSAFHPRPLWQALAAVGVEYGLNINYEDPPYSSTYDLVDDTDPGWRSKNPNAPGVTRVAGGSFQTNFPEIATPSNAQQVEAALNAIVKSYNASGNPGHFALLSSGGDRFTVVGNEARNAQGQLQDLPLILDTPVSLTGKEVALAGALESVAKQLTETSKMGVKVELGSVPMNALVQTRSVLTATNEKARDVIVNLLNQDKHVKLAYALLYDADTRLFFLNIGVVSRLTISPSGQREYTPVP